MDPPVRIYDDVFDAALLERFVAYVKAVALPQKVVENQSLAEACWAQLAPQLPLELTRELTEILPLVTVTHTRQPIGRHYDRRHAHERAKVLVFLNEVPEGGTLFHLPRPHATSLLVENRRNRVVVFDLGLAHESQRFAPQHTKMAIGFRLR